MKRPLLHIAIAFGAGILAAWFVKQVIYIALVFVLMLWINAYGKRHRICYTRNLLLWSIFFLTGYLNYAIQFTMLQYPLLPFYENPVTLQGYVNGGVKEEGKTLAFDLQVETIDAHPVNRVVRVNVYEADPQAFRPGKYLLVEGVLRKPAPSVNPGGFNYSAYLLARKTPAILSVSMNKITPGNHDKHLPLRFWGLRTKQRISDILDQNLSIEKAALMKAMLTGTRESLSEPMEDAFRASGLMHIMAVSGAHIAFLLFPMLWILKKMGMNRRIGAGITIPCLFLYAVITGLSASVMRASLMAAVMLAGKIFDRRAEVINSLGAASFILLAINPFMLFDVGFQLSVGATLGIGLLYKRIVNTLPQKIPNFIRRTLSATLAAQIGILPILIRSFSKVSLISVLSNLLVVPITGISIALGAVTVIMGSVIPAAGTGCGFALEGLLHLILAVTEKMSSFAWAEVGMHHWRLWWVCLYYMMAGLLGCCGWGFILRHKRKFTAGVFVLGMVLFLGGIRSDRMKIIFIDVGQGDSALIQTTKGFNLLIDGGGSYNEEETKYIGHQVLFPLLMHEGVSRIDMVLVSHAHTDHLSGILTLMEVFPVKSVGLPDYPNVQKDFSALLQRCEEKGSQVGYYDRGDLLQLDEESFFKVLYPDKEITIGQDNLNNTSLSGVLQFKNLQVLFSGDMEQEAERVFMDTNPVMDCDILKVAHHGGKNSTTEDFLLYTMPEAAVISVGRNQFGHPSNEVLNRLSLAGTEVFATHQNGAVIVESNGDQYRIKTWRKEENFIFPFVSAR